MAEKCGPHWVSNSDPLFRHKIYLRLIFVSGTLSALNYLSTKIATSCGAKREDELKNEKLR